MDRHIGSIDFDVGLSAPQFYVGNKALDHLNLEAVILELCQSDFGVFPKPQEVRVIQLHFRARSGTNGYRVAGHQRRVYTRLSPVT
jgi:hypothetical protein